MIEYVHAQDIKERVREITMVLDLKHLHADRVACIRSHGTNSKRILARCHALPRIMQTALATGPFYVVEVVSERFDKLSEEEQTKTLIHELAHIPKAFGGGFRGHGYVNRRLVDKLYNNFLCAKAISAERAQKAFI
ncbi:putative metallopeptidase [Elusimicrobiota bacterium]